MKSTKRVCIFVDGENLRHTIVDLFPPPAFSARQYLPQTDWTKLFNWITEKVGGSDAERVRTYWYVVGNIDFAPEKVKSFASSRPSLEKLLKKNSHYSELYKKSSDAEKESVLHSFADFLFENKDAMTSRFSGWTHIQNQIAQNCEAVEFRRAGAIRYDLVTKELGSEKAVDIKLATDLIRLKDIYDIAVIVSGDQDYVPAVEAIKDYGKKVVNVAFLTSNNRLLPGGARRLNQATDYSHIIEHADLKRHLGL